MANPFFGIAVHIVNLLGIHTFLGEHRHHIREKIFTIYKDERGAKKNHFLMDLSCDGTGAPNFVIAMIQAVSSVDGYNAAIEALIERSDGKRDRARVKATLYVLLYILKRATQECASDLDDWHEWERLIREDLEEMGALKEDADLNVFDPDRIYADIDYVCREVLCLDRYIADKFEKLAQSIRQAYDARNLPPDEGEMPGMKALRQMEHHAAAVLCTGSRAGGIDAARAEVSNAFGAHVDPMTIITIYALLYLANQVSAHDPSMHGICAYFYECCIARLASVC